MEIIMSPIGYIKSPYKEKSETPMQSYLSSEIGKIIVESSLVEGLYSLKEGQYIELFFYFDSATEFKLKFKHHLSNEERGIFNTRSPNRPNGIGKSIVKILKIKDYIIEFTGVDMLDNTPVLDIKPYCENLNPKI